MAIDFPNSPTSGQVFRSGANYWTYNGTYWESTLPNDYVAVVSREADTVVNNGVTTAVVFDTFTRDPKSMWSSGDNAILVPDDGMYAWAVRVKYASGAGTVMVYSVWSGWDTMASGLEVSSGTDFREAGGAQFFYAGNSTGGLGLNFQNTSGSSATVDYVRLWLKKL